MKKWTKHEALGYLDKQIEVIHTLKLGRRGSSEHVRWLTNTLVFLEEIFGSDSYYYCNIKNLTWQFHGQRIYRGWDIDGAMEAYNQEAYVEQLEQANGFLLAAKDYLDANDIDTVYCASVEKQATGDLMKVLSLSERKLRKVIRTKPEREKEIQDQFENLLIGADIEFEREGPHIDYSSKAYIPDFSFNSIDLAVIQQINDDILAYKTKFNNLLFIIYDLGVIRDVDTFKQSFEETENVIVHVIKH